MKENKNEGKNQPQGIFKDTAFNLFNQHEEFVI